MDRYPTLLFFLSSPRRKPGPSANTPSAYRDERLLAGPRLSPGFLSAVRRSKSWGLCRILGGSSRGPVLSRWETRERWGTSFGTLLTRACSRRQGRGCGGSAFFGRGVRRRLGVSRRWRGSFLGRGTGIRRLLRRLRVRILGDGFFRTSPLGARLGVVGHVPPGALELEGRRRDKSFDGPPAGGAGGEWAVREPLQGLEASALLAVVFVKRHGGCLFLGKRRREA